MEYCCCTLYDAAAVLTHIAVTPCMVSQQVNYKINIIGTTRNTIKGENKKNERKF
jgi:hypothetical protein